MNIAILGGAFDPPHLGHQLIAHQVLDFAGVKEVWLTPCYQHTFEKKLTKTEHRVAMTKMLINKKIKYSSEEIDNQLSGDTIDLMKILEKKYPQHHFSFIIGSDNLKSLRRWGRWEKLISSYHLLIFPRAYFKGSLANFNLNLPEYKLKLIKHPLLVTTDISSTNIRERIKKGLSISGLVPEKVEEYIKRYNLYK
jgi:nicotinate-nucleotide adenylyltransferase